MTTMTEDRLDAAFAALADPTRRAIVSRLARGDATVSELAAPFAMSLPGISKHLKVLERSGLISRRRDAQFRPCHLEVEALDGALDWIAAHRRTVGRALRQARRAAGRPAAGAGDDGGERTGRARRMAEQGATAEPANELRFSRVFDAPRELVFRCMTDPDHLTHFWGPTGVSAPRAPHHGRRPARRRVRDGDGQRRRRQRVPDACGLRRGAASPSCCRGPSRTRACG